MKCFSLNTARALAITVGLGIAVAACNNDSGNTAPLVATGITADNATNNQTATAGAVLPQPVAVHVTDQNGAPIANVTVTWTTVNGGTVSSPSSTTDATGSASVTWTLATTAETDSLKASIFSGASTMITATGTTGSATTETKVSGDNQVDATGSTSAPFVVKVVDQFNNPVSGVVVSWTTTGGATLSAVTSTTDATGQTSVTMAIPAGGTYTITAAAGAASSVTFNLVATP
jgi:protocatechuate 3,4-dioxygenase beta subunit